MHAPPQPVPHTPPSLPLEGRRGGVVCSRPLASFSLVEVLVAVAILGILAASALPVVGKVGEAGARAKALRNAQTIAAVSSALAAVGEAHVLPESLGGALATAMILREGVVVSQGAFAGQLFTIGKLTDQELERAVNHLKIIYDLTELRMIYDPQSKA